MLYLKEVPFAKKFFGYVIAVLGLIIFFTANILFGVIFMVIGLNLVSTDGSEIDLQSKTYRIIKSIFGINIGKWKPCPEFEYLSVFKTKESQTITVVTATTTITCDIIHLNLFYGANKHLTFYKTDDKAEAFKVAEHFKLALDIDILDATDGENKWL